MKEQSPPKESTIKLDDVTLKTRAEHLPERMRDPFAWLGSYLRDECARDLHILTERFQEAGVLHDQTTWSKIMRGRWRFDADGHELPSPVISEEKFLRAVELLKKHEERRQAAGRVPFIMTDTARGIFKFIEFRRSPEIVCKFGIVIGETGSGKTATFKEYKRLNNHWTTNLVEAPATPSMHQFITDLAHGYGCSKQASYIRKQQSVAGAVDRSKLIIIDNVQRLYRPRDEGNQPIFHYLHKLQEDTGCTIILSFTPTFEKTFLAGADRGYFEQFEGRSGGRKNFHRLASYPPEKDVIAIAHGFGLRDAKDHADYLVKIAREPGRIRILFETLQQAQAKAQRDKRALGIGHVRWARDEEEQ